MVFFASYHLIKLAFKRQTGATTLTITIIIYFATGINDMLYFNDIIKSTTLTQVGLFVLILGQSMTLARIFNKAFVENERLTNELDYHNKNLQKLVDERTKEITSQKQDILQKNEELKVQKEELQVQKEEILRQHDMLEQHNKMFSDSIHYASTIQLALLPSYENINKYFNSFVIFLPKDIVSGDFYWFNDTKEKYLYMIVGDCTGHGVPGAFISLIVMYLLNTIIIEKQIEAPKEILEYLEKLFDELLKKGNNNNRDGVELIILRFEKENLKKLTFASSKIKLLLYNAKQKEIIQHKGTRRSIGVVVRDLSKRLPFEDYELEISADDTLYLSSDGIIDQNNAERTRFGTPKFLELLKENANLPLQQQKISIIKNLELYKENQFQRDDITIIGLKLKS